jgi:hypothetical protein
MQRVNGRSSSCFSSPCRHGIRGDDNRILSGQGLTTLKLIPVYSMTLYWRLKSTMPPFATTCQKRRVSCYSVMWKVEGWASSQAVVSTTTI